MHWRISCTFHSLGEFAKKRYPFLGCLVRFANKNNLGLAFSLKDFQRLIQFLKLYSAFLFLLGSILDISFLREMVCSALVSLDKNITSACSLTIRILVEIVLYRKKASKGVWRRETLLCMQHEP